LASTGGVGNRFLINSAFRELVGVCADLAARDGLLRVGSGEPRLSPSQVSSLRHAIESSPQFGALCRAALHELPRYCSSDPPDFPNELAGFLERSGLLTSILTGSPIDIQLLTYRLWAESARTSCQVARLVVLDGLSIGDASISFGDAALLKLEPASLQSFFSEVTLLRPSLPDYLNGLIGLRTEARGNSPPWDSYSLPEPPTHPATVVQDAAQPWLDYINSGYLRHSGDPTILWSKVHGILAYLTSDSYGAGGTATACCTSR
jgi:hypothetical protein